MNDALTSKERYYAQHRDMAIRRYRPWDESDLADVQNKIMPDPHLAIYLGRSIGAIQLARYRMKKGGK